MSDAD